MNSKQHTTESKPKTTDLYDLSKPQEPVTLLGKLKTLQTTERS